MPEAMPRRRTVLVAYPTSNSGVALRAPVSVAAAPWDKDEPAVPPANPRYTPRSVRGLQDGGRDD